LQAFWRAWRCRSERCTVWRAEFDVLSETTKQQQLRPLHRLFSLFHRVYRPQDPACLHMLARVCESIAAVQSNKLIFASCVGEELDRACLHVARTCTATLQTLQHQGCVSQRPTTCSKRTLCASVFVLCTCGMKDAALAASHTHIRLLST
jgi:hypothetical protein